MSYRVQIIAPSSGVQDANQLAQELANLFVTKGLGVKPALDLFAQNTHYYANTMEKRLEALSSALLDPEVDIIWAFRGGYGASEIAIRCMDIKPSHKKILIGYSDITVLHELFHRHYEMPSIHGPCGTSLLRNQAKHMDDIMVLLNGNDTKIALKPMTKAAEGCDLKSSVVGGNLAVLTTMIGTKLNPYTKDKILLLEDVGEKGYSVRRMLNHCDQAGVLDYVGAIVFGDFTKSDEHLDFAFEDFCARNSHTPMFKIEGVGHGDTNIPVVLGYNAEIKCNSLIISSPFGK